MNAAAQAYEQAQRQYERMVKLRETGVVSAQQVEDVEIRRNTAQSDREAARSRVVTARQMLERTEVRAPFDGIISDRKVSAGDTVATIEAMKMEASITAPVDGTVERLAFTGTQAVDGGDLVMALG